MAFLLCCAVLCGSSLLQQGSALFVSVLMATSPDHAFGGAAASLCCPAHAKAGALPALAAVQVWRARCHNRVLLKYETMHASFTSELWLTICCLHQQACQLAVRMLVAYVLYGQCACFEAALLLAVCRARPAPGGVTVGLLSQIGSSFSKMQATRLTVFHFRHCFSLLVRFWYCLVCDQMLHAICDHMEGTTANYGACQRMICYVLCAVLPAVIALCTCTYTLAKNTCQCACDVVHRYTDVPTTVQRHGGHKLFVSVPCGPV